jgi:hypothetical protein
MSKIAPIKGAIALIFLSLLLVLAGCDYEGNVNAPDNNNSDNPSHPEATVWNVSIEKVNSVLQGHYKAIAVTADFNSTAIGGFDLLIAYDAYALVFTEADLGEYGINCDWEYFTYRFGPIHDCDNNCRSGLIRLVGIAETNNGAHHPDYDCLAQAEPRTLAILTFFTSNDRQFEGTTHPIDFYWVDCGDNSVATIDGDTLALNRHVYDYTDSLIESSIAELPGYWGAPDDPCLQGDQWQPIRYIDFHNGFIEFPPCDSIDIGPSDININGVAFEIADAVMLSKYFIQGTAVFNNHVPQSTAASDVNDDDHTLTVADLVYMIRVIVGDALPLPLPAVHDTVDVYAQNGYISFDSPVDIGAALFVFDINGNYGDPILYNDDMDILYGEKDGKLRVLVYNIGEGYLPSGQSLVLSVPGAVLLNSAELATFNGAMIESTNHLK